MSTKDHAPSPRDPIILTEAEGPEPKDHLLGHAEDSISKAEPVNDALDDLDPTISDIHEAGAIEDQGEELFERHTSNDVAGKKKHNEQKPGDVAEIVGKTFHHLMRAVLKDPGSSIEGPAIAHTSGELQEGPISDNITKKKDNKQTSGDEGDLGGRSFNRLMRTAIKEIESSLEDIMITRTTKELQEQSRKSMKEHVTHIRVQEARLRGLEQRLDKLEVQPSLKPNKVVPPERVAAIPTPNYVEWDKFKEPKDRQGPGHHAIDVLIGEPVLYHQVHNAKGMKRAASEAKSEQSSVYTSFKEVPERIRINSAAIIEMLPKLTDEEFATKSAKQIIILRPYKPLLYHLEELRRHLNKLEKNWGPARRDMSGESKSLAHDFPADFEEESKKVDQIPHETLGDASGRGLGTPPTGHTKVVDPQRSKDNLETGHTNDEKDGEPQANDGGRETNAAGSNEHRVVTKGTTALYDSAEARDDLACLIQFLDKCLGIVNTRVQAGAGRPRVLFQDLWHLFKPGTFIFSKRGPQPVWRVLQRTGGRNFLCSEEPNGSISGHNLVKGSAFTIDCYYIDFEGKEFGPLHESFEIASFEGLKDVTSLDFFPIQYHEKMEEIVRDAKERGKNFIRASRVNHMYCKGRTLVQSPAGSPLASVKHPEDIDSPVMVDFDRTFQFNPDWRPNLGWKKITKQSMRETTEMTVRIRDDDLLRHIGKRCLVAGCCTNEKILGDHHWDLQESEHFLEERQKEIRMERKATDDAKLDAHTIPEQEWILLPNRVFGFVLRSRKWASLPLDQMDNMEKDLSGLDRLELPLGHRDIIDGLVKTHFDARATKNCREKEFGLDAVRAKGKGLIILLHGAPGVGKTSTAECMASANAKPLFPITCGDLGMTPEKVEESLEFNFQLAQLWGCVLLLDEADVFLAERSKTDLERNALVSVFLRTLEYYSGVLFLTTNRVGTLDEAFRSRIHMSLYYPTLNEHQSQAIWTTNLSYILTQRPEVVADESEIMDYARTQYQEQLKRTKVGWNGRQIKNMFQTALALADYDSKRFSRDPQNTPRPNLKREHFEKVVKAARLFDEYLAKTLHMPTARYTQSQRWRTDYLEPSASQPPAAREDAPTSWPAMNAYAQNQSYQWPAAANTVRNPGNLGVNPMYVPDMQTPGGYTQGSQAPNLFANMAQGYPQMMPNMQPPQVNMPMYSNTQVPQGHMMGMNNMQQGPMAGQMAEHMGAQIAGQTGNQPTQTENTQVPISTNQQGPIGGQPMQKHPFPQTMNQPGFINQAQHPQQQPAYSMVPGHAESAN